MASSAKAVLERWVPRSSAAGESDQRAISDLPELEARQLGDAVAQFHTATAKVLKTTDDALHTARLGNERISEFNSRILAKLDELDGRKPAW